MSNSSGDAAYRTKEVKYSKRRDDPASREHGKKRGSLGTMSARTEATIVDPPNADGIAQTDENNFSQHRNRRRDDTKLGPWHLRPLHCDFLQRYSKDPSEKLNNTSA
ncbi:hypothetical protein GQ600_7642 [Phytophthora cactorum]|nr:hypothetical protein GQ600_7642 [Phytophthora cactorum]